MPTMQVNGRLYRQAVSKSHHDRFTDPCLDRRAGHNSVVSPHGSLNPGNKLMPTRPHVDRIVFQRVLSVLRYIRELRCNPMKSTPRFERRTPIARR